MSEHIELWAYCGSCWKVKRFPALWAPPLTLLLSSAQWLPGWPFVLGEVKYALPNVLQEGKQSLPQWPKGSLQLSLVYGHNPLQSFQLSSSSWLFPVIWASSPPGLHGFPGPTSRLWTSPLPPTLHIESFPPSNYAVCFLTPPVLFLLVQKSWKLISLYSKDTASSGFPLLLCHLGNITHTETCVLMKEKCYFRDTLNTM